mgnify:CR=1 FL=1
MSRTKKKEGAVRGKTTNRIINILLVTWLSDDFISTVYDSDHCI